MSQIFAHLAMIAAANGGNSPIAFFPLDGRAQDMVSGAMGTLLGDACFNAMGWLRFGGSNGGVVFEDSPLYGFDGSFTISVDVFPTRAPVGGTSPAGQIVFRGDDRNGLDNYSLSLGNDGYYTFCIFGSDNEAQGVRANARIGEWERITAVFDATARELRLYVGGVIVGQCATPILPVTKMEREWVPRLAIGNVQNPLGGQHNQPFCGSIRNVRLYDCVVFPTQIPVGR